MSMSLAITAGSRPYTDSENNMVSILFCVVDILGAVSSIVPKIMESGNRITINYENQTDFEGTDYMLANKHIYYDEYGVHHEDYDHLLHTNAILSIVALVSLGVSLLVFAVYCVVYKCRGKCKQSSPWLRYFRVVSVYLFLFGLPIFLATFGHLLSVNEKFRLGYSSNSTHSEIEPIPTIEERARFKSYYYNSFQIAFVITLMIALLVVVVLASKAMRERIRTLNDAMSNSNGTKRRSIWKAYTKCETIFLFPILVIIFVVSYISQKLCGFLRERKKKQHLTTVLPSNTEPN